MSIRNPQITFIVGPTASGKSAQALQFAKVNNCNILSADSRQIYQGIEITSGADVASDFNFIQVDFSPSQSGYFYNGEVKIFGISSLHPTKVWSIGQFQELFQFVYTSSLLDGKGVVIVGGSGLYAHSLLLKHEQLHIPPNDILRKSLKGKNVEELQQEIQKKYPQFATTFNQSDWQNPRRLIRLLEILQSQKVEIVKKEIDIVEQYVDVNGKKVIPKWIGLSISKDELKNKIVDRVRERVSQGAIQEVENLIAKIEDKTASIFTATGVREIIGYLHGQYDQDQLIELWSLREFQYAKRQMTWFKKREYIRWQDK